MAATDLKLEECGTLPKLGPVGRPVRLGLGILGQKNGQAPQANFSHLVWMLHSTAHALSGCEQAIGS